MKNLQKVFKEIGKKLVFQFKRELEQKDTGLLSQIV